METDTFIPGAQQREALDQIIEWYYNESGPQVFHLFGYAGTGKTTLARHVVDELDLNNVCYAAYTGKAAHVMATRGGCLGAQTIHSLIYQPLGSDDTELRRLNGLLADVTRKPGDRTPEQLDQDRAALEEAIAAEQRKPRALQFTLREDSDLVDADLLILDEASMVNSEMAQDLLSFGVKILVLGDPAQLPPVSGAGYFTNVGPDYLLTEVHRAALDSPITRIATSIRSSPPGDASVGVSGSDGNCGRFRGVRNLAAYDQVICGTNRVRWQLINRIRELEGNRGPRPVPGDRIMVLTNSRDAGVFNGQQLRVLSCEIDEETRRRGEKYLMRICDDSGSERDMRVWADGFVNAAGEKAVTFSGRGLTVAATFAHAITCHKSQGSEWGKVLVVDESGVFRAMRWKDLVKTGHSDPDGLAHVEARRWLYTAVTRASDRVSIVLPQAALA
jgi:exodeoxyribonuclease-5